MDHHQGRTAEDIVGGAEGVVGGVVEAGGVAGDVVVDTGGTEEVTG